MAATAVGIPAPSNPVLLIQTVPDIRWTDVQPTAVRLRLRPAIRNGAFLKLTLKRTAVPSDN